MKRRLLRRSTAKAVELLATTDRGQIFGGLLPQLNSSQRQTGDDSQMAHCHGQALILSASFSLTPLCSCRYHLTYV